MSTAAAAAAAIATAVAATMATTMAPVAAVATTMATVAAVAAIATMAPMTTVATAAITGAAAATIATAEDEGRSLVLTAHQGDSNEREKHRETKNHNSIHFNPPITYRYRKREIQSSRLMCVSPWQPTAQRQAM
jgi:hypothetical protein